MARTSARSVLLRVALLTCGACVHIPTDKDIDEGHTYYDLGVNDMTNGRYESALDNFQRSVSYNSNFADVHMALGLIWWRKARIDGSNENYRKAREEFETAVDLRPGFSDAWNNLGALCIERKDYARAVKAFKMALADPVYKSPYVARSNLGWVYHLQGNDKEAMAQIRESLIAEPRYCMGHKQLASVLEDMSRPAEAAAEWESFVRYCPDDPEAQYHEGKRQMDLGALEPAAEAFLRCQLLAGKINPSHVLISTCSRAQEALPQLPPEVVVKIRREILPSTVPTDTAPHDIDTGAH